MTQDYSKYTTLTPIFANDTSCSFYASSSYIYTNLVTLPNNNVAMSCICGPSMYIKLITPTATIISSKLVVPATGSSSFDPANNVEQSFHIKPYGSNGILANARPNGNNYLVQLDNNLNIIKQTVNTYDKAPFAGQIYYTDSNITVLNYYGNSGNSVKLTVYNTSFAITDSQTLIPANNNDMLQCAIKFNNGNYLAIYSRSSVGLYEALYNSQNIMVKYQFLPNGGGNTYLSHLDKSDAAVVTWNDPYYGNYYYQVINNQGDFISNNTDFTNLQYHKAIDIGNDNFLMVELHSARARLYDIFGNNVSEIFYYKSPGLSNIFYFSGTYIGNNKVMIAEQSYDGAQLATLDLAHNAPSPTNGPSLTPTPTPDATPSPDGNGTHPTSSAAGDLVDFAIGTVGLALSALLAHEAIAA